MKKLLSSILCFSLIAAMLSVAFVINTNADAPDFLVDALADASKIHSQTADIELWPAHPFYGGIPALTKKAVTPQSIVYNVKNISNFEIIAYACNASPSYEYSDTIFRLKMELSADNSSWAKYSYEETKDGTMNDTNAPPNEFGKYTLTPDAAIAAGMNYMRLTLGSDVTWDTFINHVKINESAVPLNKYNINVSYTKEDGTAIGTAPAPYIFTEGDPDKVFTAATIQSYIVTGYKLNGGNLVSGASFTASGITSDQNIVFVYKEDTSLPPVADDEIRDKNDDYSKVQSKTDQWETEPGNPHANKESLRPHPELGVNVFGTVTTNIGNLQNIIYRLDGVKNLAMQTYNYYAKSGNVITEHIGDALPAEEGDGVSGNPIEVNSGYGTYGVKVYTSANGTNWTEFEDLEATRGINHDSPTNAEAGWSDWTIRNKSEFPAGTNYIKLEKNINGGYFLFYGNIVLAKGAATLEDAVYHNITVNYVDTSGAVIASQSTVNVIDKGSITVKAAPVNGYVAKSLKVNGGAAQTGTEYTFSNVSSPQTIDFVYEVYVPAVTDKTIYDDCSDYSKVYEKTAGWEVREDNVGNPFGNAGIEVKYHPELKVKLFARKSGDAGSVESLTYNLEGLKRFNMKAFIAYDLEKKENLVEPLTDIEDNKTFGIKVWVSSDNKTWKQVTYTASRGKSIAKDSTNFNPITGEPMPKYEWYEWNLSSTSIPAGMNFIRFDNGYPVGWVQFFGPITISTEATGTGDASTALPGIILVLVSGAVVILFGRKRSKEEII